MLKPEILFDHLYVVILPDHYAAMKQDRIWNQLFATTYESTVKTGEGNEWTGFYCTTLDHRYIELFYEGPRLNEDYRVGASGLGLCSETIDRSSELESYFNSHYPDQKPLIVSRTIDSKKLNRKIDWFTYTMPSDYPRDPFLKPWIMDYQRDYIEAAKVPLKTENKFDRDQFSLSELKPDSTQSQISAVKEIRLQCRANELDRFCKQLIALGGDAVEPNCFEFGKVSIQIDVVEKVRMRIAEVVFNLTQTLEINHSIAGGSTLIASGKVLTWKI